MTIERGVRWWFGDTSTPEKELVSAGAPPKGYTPQPASNNAVLSGLYLTTPRQVPSGLIDVPSAGGLVDPLTLKPWVAPADSTFPDLPDQNTVEYTAFRQAGDTLKTTLARIQAYLVAQGTGVAGYAQVHYPNGFDESFADFLMAGSSKYGLFFNRILGHICDPNQARITLEPMSSTVGSEGTMGRFAGTVGAALPGGLVPVNYGITFVGNDQPNQTYPQGGEVGPQLYSGIVQYGGVGAINQQVVLLGTSQGNWNSPPGEKFSWNSYKCVDCVWRACRVSGFNGSGRRSGASPFGGNNSVRDVIEDSYFHDSYVSSLTWSFAGSSSSMTAASSSPTTRRTRVEWNANHSAAGTSGKGFGVVNHENVMGAIRHFNPVWFAGNGPGDDDNWLGHVAFANALVDNQDIWIINPVWNALHPKTNGMLYIKMSKFYDTPTTDLNAQVTPPLIKLGANPTTGAGGTTLTPVVYTGSGAPSVAFTQSPSTHYILAVA